MRVEIAEAEKQAAEEKIKAKEDTKPTSVEKRKILKKKEKKPVKKCLTELNKLPSNVSKKLKKGYKEDMDPKTESSFFKKPEEPIREDTVPCLICDSDVIYARYGHIKLVQATKVLGFMSATFVCQNN